MILKPSSCQGCPFYDKGKYFTPDRMVPGSRVLFIAQNPGRNEEEGKVLEDRTWSAGRSHDVITYTKPQPLIGATGKAFKERYLPLAGLDYEEVSLANALRCRPGSDLGLRADELPPITTAMKLETSKADIVKALKHCRDAHLKIPSSVDTIVAMGRYAMFSLTGIQKDDNEYGQKTGVMESWRGYSVDSDAAIFRSPTSFRTVDVSSYHPLTSSHRIFFMLHLAALFQPAFKHYQHAALADFQKLGRMLRSEWPKALPMDQFTNDPPPAWPSYSCFDSEYIPDQNDKLTSWSLCDTKGNSYVVSTEQTRKHMYQADFHPTVLIQNVITSADLKHLNYILDTPSLRLEDLLVAQSVLYTGEPKSLNYIASLYGDYNRHKHLGADSILYGHLDARVPMDVWKDHYIPEFKRDRQSWIIYRDIRMELVSIIHEAQQTGCRIDSERLVEIQGIYLDRLERYRQQAREVTGNPEFKLSASKEVMEYLYD